MEPKNSTIITGLVCTRESSQELVNLGLHRAAMFHWWDGSEDDITIETDKEGNNLEEKWRCGVLFAPGEEAFPAWTYEELRIMIGNRWNAADLAPDRPRPMPGERETFYVYFPDYCKQFQSGAEANALILKTLLEEGSLTAKEVNDRYFEKFKTQ